jgi:hypothetical protein
MPVRARQVHKALPILRKHTMPTSACLIQESVLNGVFTILYDHGTHRSPLYFLHNACLLSIIVVTGNLFNVPTRVTSNCANQHVGLIACRCSDRAQYRSGLSAAQLRAASWHIPPGIPHKLATNKNAKPRPYSRMYMNNTATPYATKTHIKMIAFSHRARSTLTHSLTHAHTVDGVMDIRQTRCQGKRGTAQPRWYATDVGQCRNGRYKSHNMHRPHPQTQTPVHHRPLHLHSIHPLSHCCCCCCCCC